MLFVRAAVALFLPAPTPSLRPSLSGLVSKATSSSVITVLVDAVGSAFFSCSSSLEGPITKREHLLVARQVVQSSRWSCHRCHSVTTIAISLIGGSPPFFVFGRP